VKEGCLGWNEVQLVGDVTMLASFFVSKILMMASEAIRQIWAFQIGGRVLICYFASWWHTTDGRTVTIEEASDETDMTFRTSCDLFVVVQ
jgi:hypothetical protein